jgi:hypothetical protein
MSDKKIPESLKPWLSFIKDKKKFALHKVYSPDGKWTHMAEPYSAFSLLESLGFVWRKYEDSRTTVWMLVENDT